MKQINFTRVDKAQQKGSSRLKASEIRRKMETKSKNENKRVRDNSTDKANQEIDRKTLQTLREFSNSSEGEIGWRLQEITKEWDIEKTLMVNA